jgi:hypothetical protein
VNEWRRAWEVIMEKEKRDNAWREGEEEGRWEERIRWKKCKKERMNGMKEDRRIIKERRVRIEKGWERENNRGERGERMNGEREGGEGWRRRKWWRI